MNEDKIIEVYNKGITKVISLIKNKNNRLNRLSDEHNNLSNNNVELNGEIARLKKENKELTIKLEEFDS